MLADKEFGRFEVRPITGALGAELKGVDLLAADDPTFEDVRKALYKHKVLAVRGQELAPESLSRVARRFGAFSGNPVHQGLERRPSGLGQGG